MKYKTLNEFKEETHPWEPFVPVKANKLLLGTFPTAERNRSAYEFFYPNPKNNFWKILFKIAGKDLDNYKKSEPIKIRQQILKELNLGVGDIGKRILRQKESSKDNNLFPIEYTDIFSIIESNNNIKKIIITSSSGVNSVLSWFHHYCFINDIHLEIPEGKLPLRTKLFFNKNEINIEIISSPSGQSRVKGEELFDMYRNAILKD